ncbi:MAG: D-alanine--D-alanine ligase [Planctomycetota bacterium]|nr:MAG: D-alanine--D-alanine ligase [Planctomycetota bacterium]
MSVTGPRAERTNATAADRPRESGDADRPRPTGADIAVSGNARSSSAKRTLDITVLAGGPSDEREVSLESGRAVTGALHRVGHRVAMRDVSPADLSALERPCDLVFIALHGAFGEDGTLQAELERRGLPYTGSGPEASRLAMDKAAAKTRFEQTGLPTPAYAVVEAGDAERVNGFPLPAVVKPVASGSSVDTTIARTHDALRESVRRVTKRHGRALVEAYIDGPELTVGIVGGEALPVCEVRPAREFYDYQAKYLDDRTQYLFDPDLPRALLAEVQAMSLAAHRALGCRVLSRVDWMVQAETMEPFLLEINTIPGFTSHSLVPKAAAQVGWSFETLCERIVSLSLGS